MRRTPIWRPSPNFEKGRRGRVPRAIVIHIAEGSRAAVDSWFGSKESGVSAHYLVTLGGEVDQFVLEEDMAWHAGRILRPTWEGLEPNVNPNTYCLGIEHEGQATQRWVEPMLQRSAMLLAELHVRWDIPLDRAHVVGHHEIYAAKTCPGLLDLNELLAAARRYLE